jgi:hypothetical protein
MPLVVVLYAAAAALAVAAGDCQLQGEQPHKMYFVLLLLLLLLLQVTAEFKKANGLIKPGPKTVKVWAALYAEIEKVRCSYGQGAGTAVIQRFTPQCR